jgi:carbamoyl-phosphate synthase small subunit
MGNSHVNAALALEDGSVFFGTSCGAPGERPGEVVFCTAMTGYQEVLTDPSYCGQIVTMTCPEIGNYGVNPEDVESWRPQVSGFVMRECWTRPSNWRSTQSLPEYLRQWDIVALEGIDTRRLTRILRVKGTMNGVISTEDLDADSLVAKARAWEGLEGRDLVQLVTCQQPYQLGPADAPFHVAALDYGIKQNILRNLVRAGCRVTVLPAQATAEDILSLDPDGIFLSNGPGDPRPLAHQIDTCRNLIGKRPIFGICLGHEILGLAFGGTIYHMKFGHRGANQPVQEHQTGRVLITSENHGWALDPKSLPDCLEPTRVNLNDGTVEGLRHKELPVLSIQCHPEASPGPHDSIHLFADFLEMMRRSPRQRKG